MAQAATRDHPQTTNLHGEIWEYLRKVHEPALGRLRHAVQLAPSPDGKRIVFSGRSYDGLEGNGQLRLGIVDVKVGWPHNLDAFPGSATSPVWSPDGNALAYVSNGNRLAVNGRLLETQFDGVVEEIAWNADSRRLLVRVAGRGADASGAAGSGTVAEGRGDRASWEPYVESGFSKDAWRKLYVVDVSDAGVVGRSPDGDNVWEAVWSGDGAIVAVASSDPSESSWYRARLVWYDIAGAQRRELHAPREEMGLPSASPDGRFATIIEACCSDRTLVAGDLTLVDLHNGTTRTIETNGVDVTFATWRDRYRLFFIGLRRLQTVAGEYDLRDGSVRETWTTSESCGDYAPIAWPIGSGDAFVTVVDSYGRYQRITGVENGAEHVLCDLGHDGTAFIASTGGRTEAVTWTGRDGLEIDGYLVLPEGKPPFPLVVNVHGGPVYSFRNDWTMHYYYVPMLAHFGYAILNPNPRGSRGRGQPFARMVRGDMCGEDAHDILRGIDALVERGTVDSARVAVMGRSYGGYMSSWLVTQTQRFAAAIPMAPVTDNVSHHFTANIPEFNRRFLADSPYRVEGRYTQRSPIFFADRVTTPTLSMAGARDRCTPAGQAIEFHRALAENGTPCELVIYPEEGHHVDRLEAQADQITRVVDWLRRYLPTAK